MGVDLALLRFFDACHVRDAFHGPMLALGSLEIQERPDTIDAFARENGYGRLLDDRSVRSLFADRYALDGYVSCDVNQLADIEIDLNFPLPSEYRDKYFAILNGGTLEHVLDLRQSLQNVHDATMIGGVMIHTTPVSWYDHGFFNFNPVLFHLLAGANNYEIVCEGFYYNPPALDGQTKPVVSILGMDATIPGSTMTNASIWAKPNLPANAMHLIALRKTANQHFVVPKQVSEELTATAQEPATPTPAANLAGMPFPTETRSSPAFASHYTPTSDAVATGFTDFFKHYPVPTKSTNIGGGCWYVADLGLPQGNTNEFIGQSAAALYEDGLRIGPSNALVEHIKQVGAGAFNHWENGLYFSSSDNSDPNLNNRRYEIRVPAVETLPSISDLRWRADKYPACADLIDLYIASTVVSGDFHEVIRKYASVTMLHWHVLAIYDLLAHRSKGLVVEIGAYVGGGTLALARASRNVFVSIECGGSYLGHPTMPSSDIIADLKSNLRRFDQIDRVELVETPSGSPVAEAVISDRARRHGGIDLLAIDADGDVMRDLRFCYPYMNDNCFVVLDDYYRTIDYKGALVIEAVDKLVELGALDPCGLYGWGTWVGTANLEKLGDFLKQSI